MELDCDSIARSFVDDGLQGGGIGGEIAFGLKDDGFDVVCGAEAVERGALGRGGYGGDVADDHGSRGDGVKGSGV